MTNLRSQRTIAAKVLKCGTGRVWIDPAGMERASSAITRQDVRSMINSGIIMKKRIIGTSRKRVRDQIIKKRKGRRRGPGSIKGALNAQVPRKRTWIRTIRPLRRYLFGLKVQGVLDTRMYRLLYRRCGGGFFRNKSHLGIYLEKEGIQIKSAGSGPAKK